MTTIYSNNETVNINPTDDLVLYKEEFINSRIEKFLYAICALDFNDLPTPLSRIEELYKCLATGLPAPTFVPQSRVEKYLMAILGAYDASALPAPQSRTEVLLNKILLGDTDLSDIEWLKSRCEFLLAYIAKSGENDGDITKPVQFVDYSLDNDAATLYNTIEYPVKNAVLKGNTLVNLAKSDYKPIYSTDINIAFLSIAPLDNSKEYTLIFNKSSLVQVNLRFWYTDGSYGKDYSFSSSAVSGYVKNKVDFTRGIVTGKTIENIQICLIDATKEINNIMLLEGDYTNIDIPYFEGMASVEIPTLTTTGKNLFDGKYIKSTYSSGKAISVGNEVISYPHTTSSNRRGICNIVKVIPNTTYSISIHNKPENTVILGTGYANIEDINTQSLSVIHVGSVSNSNHTTLSLTTPSNCNYMLIGCYTDYTYEQSGGTVTFNEPPAIQLEIGSTATPYEPHKSTTVSCDEEVELRKIGDIKDELNLVTGELTQRIGEVVLNGSEGWAIHNFSTTNDQCATFGIDIKDKLNGNAYRCDMFTNTGVDVIQANNIEGIYSGGKPTSFFINISKTKASTIAELKNWLSTNNVTLQYLLVEPVVKAVDLSTVDQDNKETELTTFEDITHVITSSEGLVPMCEITVATKNATDVIDAGVMSLRMDDISNSQRTLEESANAQSDDIDVTMLGLTDIYEQLL